MMEGTVEPHTAYGLCFPETGDVAVLSLQEKTVFRYCKYNNKNGLSCFLHGVPLWTPDYDFVGPRSDILEDLKLSLKLS